VEDWGAFGVSSGALCNGQPCYVYGTQYGLDGYQHTGLDIAMPAGTPMYAPMSGTVTCSGSGVGQGADGGGCYAFGCQGYCAGGAAGRIEITLDNGVVLIYGHASTSALPVGTKVQAGTMIGTSGGMNSAHTHLEARVRDASMPSGWRIVDPRTVLGGGSITQQPGGYGAQQQTYTQPTSFAQTIRQFQQSRATR
jgi:murein DD-endopeptidase MepM/ murein hydrolase activator NlpD